MKIIEIRTDQPMERPTDGQTDGPTDQPTDGKNVKEMRGRI